VVKYFYAIKGGFNNSEGYIVIIFKLNLDLVIKFNVQSKNLSNK
jgi:hypothetical protein